MILTIAIALTGLIVAPLGFVAGVRWSTARFVEAFDLRDELKHARESRPKSAAAKMR